MRLFGFSTFSKRDFGYLAGLTFFVMVCHLCLPTNVFPPDGWFYTQNVLFTQFPPESYNGRPIAVPAFFYKFGHVLTVILNGDTAFEFRLDSLLQQLMTLATGLSVYALFRTFRWHTTGFITSLLLILYLESHLLPHSFFSENFSIFFLCFLLYLIRNSLLYINFDRFAIPEAWLLGLAIGLWTITRAIPILFIPLVALLWFFFYRLKAWKPILIVTVVTAGIVLLQMSANQYRFGRFELAGSSGGSLWSTVAYDADDYLREDPTYQKIRSEFGSWEGIVHWTIETRFNSPEFRSFLARTYGDPNQNLTGSTYTHYIDLLLRDLAKSAIRAHPGKWIRHSLNKSYLATHQPPYKVGVHARWHIDPLERESFLPASIPDRGYLIGILGKAFTYLHLLYAPTMYLLIISGVLALCYLPFAERGIYRKMPPIDFRQFCAIIGLLFLAQVILLVPTNVLSNYNGRQNVLYTPLLFISTGLLFGLFRVLTSPYVKRVLSEKGSIHRVSN